MKIIHHTINNIYDLINTIKSRPALYLGDNKISSMRSFLHGYTFALDIHSIISKEEKPIPFWFFHEWIASHYNWNESTAGWCHIILAENNKDEEKEWEHTIYKTEAKAKQQIEKLFGTFPEWRCY